MLLAGVEYNILHTPKLFATLPIPQLVVHGDADRTVPVMMSRIMVEAAKKLGAVVKYLEIPGGDHTKVAVMTFKDVYDWFDTHQRQKVKGKAAGTGTPSR